jgi:methylglyoxal synthase
MTVVIATVAHDPDRATIDVAIEASAKVRRRPTMERAIGPQKTICLVAHDNKKLALTEWVAFNRSLLAKHKLVATGTTGTMIARQAGLKVRKLRSGPLGGDQQVGALIADGEIDFLVFFWDPLEPQPHDPDVKALLRIAVVWNIPIACNRASADFMISSPLMTSDYVPETPDYAEYVDRFEEPDTTPR